jgi:hypothetical protein
LSSVAAALDRCADRSRADGAFLVALLETGRFVEALLTASFRHAVESPPTEWHALSSAWDRTDTRIGFTRWKARATAEEHRISASPIA